MAKVGDLEMTRRPDGSYLTADGRYRVYPLETVSNAGRRAKKVVTWWIFDQWTPAAPSDVSSGAHPAGWAVTDSAVMDRKKVVGKAPSFRAAVTLLHHQPDLVKSKRDLAYRAMERSSFSEEGDVAAEADAAMERLWSRTMTEAEFTRWAAREIEYLQLTFWR